MSLKSTFPLVNSQSRPLVAPPIILHSPFWTLATDYKLSAVQLLKYSSLEAFSLLAQSGYY